MKWFELCTDGFAPDWLAADAQHILSTLWAEGFDNNMIDSTLVKTIGGYLRTTENSTADVIELAAGHGAAPAKWDELLRRDEHVHARMVLTDLQPDLPAWARLRNLNAIKKSVDATKASEQVREQFPDWGEGDELRMIHLALHHPDVALLPTASPRPRPSWWRISCALRESKLTRPEASPTHTPRLRSALT